MANVILPAYIHVHALIYMYTQMEKKKENITSPAHLAALTLSAWEGEHLLISQSLCWFLHREHPPAPKESCPFLPWLDLETVDENWLVAQSHPWAGLQHCFRRSKCIFCRPILCSLKLSDYLACLILRAPREDKRPCYSVTETRLMHPWLSFVLCALRCL